MPYTRIDRNLVYKIDRIGNSWRIKIICSDERIQRLTDEFTNDNPLNWMVWRPAPDSQFIHVAFKLKDSTHDVAIAQLIDQKIRKFGVQNG